MNFDSHHSLVEIGTRCVNDFLRAHPRPADVGAVDGRRLARPAQKLVDRKSGRLPLEVPKSQIERRVSLGNESAAGDPMELTIDLGIQALVIQRILANHQGRQIVFSDRARPRAPPSIVQAKPSPRWPASVSR